MLKRLLTVPIVITWFLSCVIVPTPCQGDIFRYVDERGVVHFTNTPSTGNYVFFRKEKRASSPSLNGFDDYISHWSSAYNLEEALVQAVIKVESDFDPRSRSHKGAMGMMQLLPETARDMDVSDPYDPGENIRGGSRYLRTMLNMFDDNLDMALAAYNAGPGAVQRYGGIPPYQETTNYIRKVKKYLEIYRQGKD